MNEKLKYYIALNMIPAVGSVTARKLISYTGSAEAVFKEKKSALMKIPGIGKTLAGRADSKHLIEEAEKELKYCKKNNIKILDYYHEKYPVRLKNCEDAPLVLFYRGEYSFCRRKVLSIVGTRRATSYGIEQVNSFIREISAKFPDTIIVSGLAYGIDYNAHHAALKYGLKTIAVLAHGLHTIYPWEHKNLGREITSNGCLVSDFTTKAKLDRNNFIKRNRIIAGLADATLVVESGLKGGALITADLAGSYNRDVFAIPGRAGDEMSSGCNMLIKRHKAGLIENGKDLEYYMGWDARNEDKNVQRKLFVELSKEEQLIVDFLKENGQASADILSIKLNLSLSKLSALMLNLEFSGVIHVLPGNYYKLMG